MPLKSRPVLIIFSILAALQVLSGAAALGEVIGETAFALFAIVVAAVQVGMTFYVQNGVVPVGDVAAYFDKRGQVVAGPASGVTNGKTVEVVKTELPPSEGAPVQESPSHRLDEFGQADTRLIAVAALVIAVVVLAVILF